MARQNATQPRGRRGFLIDPRLVIGILLVVGSSAGVVGIVAAADQTTQVYSAHEALLPGDVVDASTLSVTSVRLDDATELYLAPGDIPTDGLIVSRVIQPDELVALSAVGAADGQRLASVVLTVGNLAATVAPGATVDVWSARESEAGRFGPPSVLAADAVVVRLVESSSIVGGAEVQAVELLVPRTKIARVLEAVANSDALSIVPGVVPVSR